mgnify:FL=1
MNLNELFERNHDLVTVLHNYADLYQSKRKDDDFEDELEKFIRTDLVKKYFNFEDSHDAMNLNSLHLISESCVDNESKKLKYRLIEWTWDNEVHLTDETKSLLSTVNHATMIEIESKFESIKNDLYDLNDTLEMATQRNQENELIDRNDGKTDDPFDEVELRGWIYEMDLDEISDYEKFRLISDLEFYSGINSERWQDSKLKNIICKFN